MHTAAIPFSPSFSARPPLLDFDDEWLQDIKVLDRHELPRSAWDESSVQLLRRYQAAARREHQAGACS